MLLETAWEAGGCRIIKKIQRRSINSDKTEYTGMYIKVRSVTVDLLVE